VTSTADSRSLVVRIAAPIVVEVTFRKAWLNLHRFTLWSSNRQSATVSDQHALSRAPLVSEPGEVQEVADLCVLTVDSIQRSPLIVIGGSRWLLHQDDVAAQLAQNLGSDLIDGLTVRCVVYELGVLIPHSSEHVRGSIAIVSPSIQMLETLLESVWRMIMGLDQTIVVDVQR
jgi:hypothetical protein